MKYLVPVLIILVLVLTAGLGFFILQNQRLITSSKAPAPSAILESTTSALPASTPSANPTPSLTAVQNVIKTNIAAKNYEALIPYMENPTVNFTLMSTECCQPQTPQEAAKQLAYINEGVPFDFNQNSATVQNVKTKKPSLASYYIGISTSKEHAAAFKIENNKITAIELAVTYKLYDL